jgi:nucleotide-binding universal stress UspA family protein
MKAVLGVDGLDHFLIAQRLLLRFGFSDLHVDLVGAVEYSSAIIPPIGSPAYVPYGHEYELSKNAITAIVLEAEKNLESIGIPCDPHVIDGAAAHVLTHFSDSSQADMIVVGSHQKGLMSSVFLGSVTRALAISSEQSFLVGKPNNEEVRENIHAVFATDHSPYANACLDRFIEWKPKGVTHITIVTACTERLFVDPLGYSDATKAVIEPKCRALVAKLEEAGISSEYRILGGYVNDVLNGQMRETNSDILIMGAQGHGFLERMLLGSTALYQVVSAPYSVLVLRV